MSAVFSRNIAGYLPRCTSLSRSQTVINHATCHVRLVRERVNGGLEQGGVVLVNVLPAENVDFWYQIRVEAISDLTYGSISVYLFALEEEGGAWGQDLNLAVFDYLRSLMKVEKRLRKNSFMAARTKSFWDIRSSTQTSTYRSSQWSRGHRNNWRRW